MVVVGLHKGKGKGAAIKNSITFPHLELWECLKIKGKEVGDPMKGFEKVNP